MSRDRVDPTCSRRSRTAVFAPVALIIVAATVVTVFALSARVWTKSPPHAPLITAAAQNEPQNKPEPSAYHVELITLRPQGFFPSEIRRPAVRFILGIDNRTGLKDVDISLIKETGNKERQVRISRNKPDWRGVVNLTPGNYELREATHSEWVCRIILTAN